jgi:hypothetical protein
MRRFSTFPHSVTDGENATGLCWRELASRRSERTRCTQVAVFGLLLTVWLPVSALAQTTPTPSQESERNATKIGSLLMSRGSLLAKDFYPLGQLSGAEGGGYAEVQALVVSRVGGSAPPLRGLRIEVQEQGRVGRSQTSFLDVEEMDELVRAIDYFISPASQLQPVGIAGGSAEPPHREVSYSTKGAFELTCFGRGSQRRCAIQAGSIGAVSIFVEAHQLEKFRTFVEQGRVTLKQ